MTFSYGEWWRLLAVHLNRHWNEIVTRGQFDLSTAFPTNTAGAAVRVQLHFVKLLGCRLRARDIAVDLRSFAAALLAGEAHGEVTLLVASSQLPGRQLLSYDSDVSVLRAGDEVQSAMWIRLFHPIAVKVCYLKTGAPVRAPEGHPWHPTRQRKIVKLSPYKGDTQPLVARRDLRI